MNNIHLTLYDSLVILSSGLLWFGIFSFGRVPLDSFYVVLISFMIGLTLHHLGEFLFNGILRRNNLLLNQSYENVRRRDVRLRPFSQREYDLYYTLLEQNHALGSIPALEAHVAFCRDIYLPFLVFFFLVQHGKMALCFPMPHMLGGIIGIVGIFSIPLLWYRIQLRVFESVWDSGAAVERNLERHGRNS